MAETQVFSNNAETTLVGSITDTATSITVGDGSVFSSPTGVEYELATITDGANIEVVKITARATNVLTVARGVDGSTQYAFASGVDIQGRVTAGTLNRFVQNDPDGNARGSDALNIQPSRTTDTQVASGNNTVALGVDTTASEDDAVAIGRDAASSGEEAIAIGRDAIASDDNAVALGSSAQASGFSGTALGTSARATGVKSVGVGDAARGTGDYSIAIGTESDVDGDYSVAIQAKREVTIATRVVDYSQSIGDTDYAMASHITQITGPDVLPFENGRYVGGVTPASYHLSQATERTFFSPPIQAGAKAWAGTTAYGHNEVVTPVTPNGYSYYAELAAPYGGDITSSASEPTWPTTAGSTVVEGSITWHCVDLSNIDFHLPDYIRFIPTEVGFIGDADTAATGTQPTISWGTVTGTPADWKAATITTLITGAFARQSFAPTNTEGSPDMSADVTTVGTLSKSGRVFWKGICVESAVA